MKTINSAALWFGAAISVAEILTGTFLAPLGLVKGAAAIVQGHLIGGLAMLLCGLIGAETGLAAMETAKLTFGKKGGKLFAFCNAAQLAGWTAVMIQSCAVAAAALTPGTGLPVWSVVTGILILLWIAAGIERIVRLNFVTVSLLFLLTAYVNAALLSGTAPALGTAGDEISFGAAVELSAAMPLSWLPVVSDYTRRCSHKKKGTIAGCIAYGVGSIWMYMTGLMAAVWAGCSDVPTLLAVCGLGIPGLLIIVLSTVTTTFLDAVSAGISFTALTERPGERISGILALLIGLAIALFDPPAGMEDFLYLIGSIFAPMAAVQIADHFILGRRHPAGDFDALNLGLWLGGFALYRLLMAVETPFGITLPVMAAIIVISSLTGLAAGRKAKAA